MAPARSNGSSGNANDDDVTLAPVRPLSLTGLLLQPSIGTTVWKSMQKAARRTGRQKL